jgi:hypothetical protein
MPQARRPNARAGTTHRRHLRQRCRHRRLPTQHLPAGCVHGELRDRLRKVALHRAADRSKVGLSSNTVVAHGATVSVSQLSERAHACVRACVRASLSVERLATFCAHPFIAARRVSEVKQQAVHQQRHQAVRPQQQRLVHVGDGEVQHRLLLTRRARNALGTATQCMRINDSPDRGPRVCRSCGCAGRVGRAGSRPRQSCRRRPA